MRNFRCYYKLPGCFIGLIMIWAISAQAQDGLTYANNRINVNSKGRGYSAGLPKNQPDKQTLFNVLKDLNSKKGVYFLFSEEDMGNMLVEPVKDLQPRIDKILDDLLKNTGLKHKKISDQTFVILNAKEKIKTNTEYVQPDFINNNINEVTYAARFEIIKGRIANAEGTPLQGVSITVKGTTKGTTTNSRGEFSLDVNRGDVLVISSVGYLTQEITIGTEKTLDISLAFSSQVINEVVVTALGIRKESKRLGYATGRVQGEELTQAREINLGNALVGKIAGVNSSGPLTGPGGSSRVTIRGNSSLEGNNQPLFVINGIPISNDNMGNASMWGGADYGDALSGLNPDDIDEITVLKGGAAAALYGQRGRNGVILITTKSGKGKKALGIELNSNVQFDKIQNFLDFQKEYGQGTEGLKPANQSAASTTIYSAWGAKLDGSQVIGFDGNMYPYSDAGDNLSRFYETGTTYNNTIALSGGSDAGNFRVSLGDLRNSSVYPNSKYKRNTANLDLNYKLSSKWSGQANFIFTKELGINRPNLSDAVGNGNFGILFLPANVNANIFKPGYDALGNEIQLNENDPYTTNPYFAASKFENNTRKTRLMGVAAIRYSPLSWLYIQGRVTNDFFSFSRTSITPTGTAYLPGGSLDEESINNFNELNADVLVGINRNITSDLSLGVTVGANLLKQESRKLSTNAQDLAFPNLYTPGLAATRSPTLTTPEKEVQSVYGSVELGYKNTFFLNLTDRNDWSSTLPIANNSYNYPSVNASYIFSEHFKPTWLSFGKLRAGYAMVGGDAPIGATALYYRTGDPINGILTGNLNDAQGRARIPNKNIEPLKVTELEIGTELKFLKNRLLVDAAWYQKKTLNDIVAGTVSITAGYNSALLNVGKIENKGIELTVGGVPVQTRNFKWTSTFNYAHNKNKVVELAEGQTSMEVGNDQGGRSRTERAYIQHIVGLAYSQVMVFDYLRDDKGQLILTASGRPQSGDLVPGGTGVHPITGGWSNQLSYKNFTIDFLIDFKFGAVIHSGTNYFAYNSGFHKITLNNRGTDSVTVTGVTSGGDAQTVKISGQDYYGALADISINNIYDADFIKFRSLSLTYNIPASKLRNKVQGVSISVVGRNLFYFQRKTDNIDPEANFQNGVGQGLEYAGLPSTRSIGINLNVKF